MLACQQDLRLLLWLLSKSDSLCCFLQREDLAVEGLYDILQEPEDFLYETNTNGIRLAGQFANKVFKSCSMPGSLSQCLHAELIACNASDIRYHSFKADVNIKGDVTALPIVSLKSFTVYGNT